MSVQSNMIWEHCQNVTLCSTQKQMQKNLQHQRVRSRQKLTNRLSRSVRKEAKKGEKVGPPISLAMTGRTSPADSISIPSYSACCSSSSSSWSWHATWTQVNRCWGCVYTHTHAPGLDTPPEHRSTDVGVVYVHTHSSSRHATWTYVNRWCVCACTHTHPVLTRHLNTGQ